MPTKLLELTAKLIPRTTAPFLTASTKRCNRPYYRYPLPAKQLHLATGPVRSTSLNSGTMSSQPLLNGDAGLSAKAKANGLALRSASSTPVPAGAPTDSGLTRLGELVWSIEPKSSDAQHDAEASTSASQDPDVSRLHVFVNESMAARAERGDFLDDQARLNMAEPLTLRWCSSILSTLMDRACLDVFVSGSTSPNFYFADHSRLWMDGRTAQVSGWSVPIFDQQMRSHSVEQEARSDQHRLILSSHIQKYSDRYRSMYPNASVLLVGSKSSEWYFCRPRTGDRGCTRVHPDALMMTGHVLSSFTSLH